ncbi:DNA mismatch repair endonuclease MutL [Aerococcaceae bacterium WGS1372]
MGIIKQMPDVLANQIAAGEVVERPASVVKELVENSIDAKSTHIIVELKEAGIQQIIVSDNGHGMPAEDLAMAFLPHATSKIYETTDLMTINSLGFRGEALASIGSVSKVRVESKTADSESGNFIEIEGSVLVNEGKAQARKGTTMKVDSLFYNTPARLKHLKTIKTELGHTLKFMQNIAMAYPHVRFNLIHNDQEIFSSYGNNNLQQVIANVYQPSIARDLIELQSNSNDFLIKGFISKPTLTRTSRQYIHWFINGRAVKSYMLDEVLVKAYDKQLMIGRYPIAVLNIQLDPRLIDVNVHPTKQTVRLSKEEELSELITQVVKESLRTINPIPSLTEDDLPKSNPSNQNYENISLDFSYRQLNNNPETQFQNQLRHALDKEQTNHSKLKKRVDEKEWVTDDFSDQVNEDKESHHYQLKNTKNIHGVRKEAHSFKQSENSKETSYSLDFHSLRYIGQIHGTYLIAESESGFYLIDQHAAQERIRYENLMNENINVNIQQQLLMPFIFNFSTSEMLIVSEFEDRFKELGIHLELMGPTSYKLESYPDWLYYEEVEKAVVDLIELFQKNKELTVQQIKEQSIIMQSCRGAIKANHYLDDKQAIQLIRDMDGLEDPYHCPHGRPVFVEFNQTTLEKLFKRIQDSHERGIMR